MKHKIKDFIEEKRIERNAYVGNKQNGMKRSKKSPHAPMHRTFDTERRPASSHGVS